MLSLKTKAKTQSKANEVTESTAARIFLFVFAAFACGFMVKAVNHPFDWLRCLLELLEFACVCLGFYAGFPLKASLFKQTF